MPPKGYSKYRDPVKTGYTYERDSLLWLKEQALRHKQTETGMLNHLLERMQKLQQRHPEAFERLVGYGPL